MPHSIFLDPTYCPTDIQLTEALGESYRFWEILRDAALKSGKVESEGWHFSGKKFGWSYRISDKKRVLIYFLPRDGFFKVAFVFGEKAIEEVQRSTINPNLIEELIYAKKYAEGKGIRFSVTTKEETMDALEFLRVKLEF
jgi:hypothetical protein